MHQMKILDLAIVASVTVAVITGISLFVLPDNRSQCTLCPSQPSPPNQLLAKNNSSIQNVTTSPQASNQTQALRLSNFIPPSSPPPAPLLQNGTAYVNYTALAYAKRHNWGDTFVEEKYHGTDLQIIATISNALKFSATVTDPTGVIHYLTPVVQNDSRMEIQYYASVSDPDGNYIIGFNVVNGSNTSNVDLQVAGNEIISPPIPPALHPMPP